MAHGWNSFIQSLSSDTSTLRVPLDTEENLAQHIENLIDHNDLSNLVDSQETLSPETSLNSNFYSDPSTNSDFVQQKYYNDLPWPEEGGQQPVPQDCDMLNPSFLEYSDVSSSKSDVDDIKPFCDELNNDSSKFQEIGNTKNVSPKESLCSGESSESEWAERPSALECDQKETLDGAQEREGEEETCIQDHPSSASYSPCSVESEKGDQLSSASYSPSSLESDNNGGGEKEQEEVEDKNESHMKDELPDPLSAASGYTCASESDMDDASRDWEQEENDNVVKREETSDKDADVLNGAQEREQQEEDCKRKSLQAEHSSVSGTSASTSVSESGRGEDMDDASQDWEQEENDNVVKREETCVQADHTSSAIKNLSPLESDKDADMLNGPQEREQEEDCKRMSTQEEHSSVSGTSASTSVSESGRGEDMDDASQDWEQEENDNVVKREETCVQADHTSSVAIKNLSASESDKDADVLNGPQEREQEEEDCKTMQEENNSVSETSASKSVSGSEVDYDKQEQRTENQILVRQDDLHLMTSCSPRKSMTASVGEMKRDSNGNELKDQQVACGKQDEPHLDASFNCHNEESIMEECQKEEYIPSSTCGPVNHVDLQAIKISDDQDSAQEFKDTKNNTSEHSLGPCNSEPQSQLDHELISPVEETDTSSHLKEDQDQTLQEHSTHHTEPPDLFRADGENARGPFQDEHLTDDGQEPPFLSACYGEPLSGEDSVSGPEINSEAVSESCHDEREHIAEDITEHKNISKELTPQLKSSLEMSKCLQPIVLLKTMEVKDNTEAFHCAECQHATLNVDHIIEHQHSKHSQYKFQFCETCDTYLTSNELAEQHLSGIHDATPVSINTTPQALPVTYNCKYCSNTYTTRRGLITHAKKHRQGSNWYSTPTPYKCHKCGYCFAQKGNLNKHKRLVNCLPSSSQLDKEREADEEEEDDEEEDVLQDDSPNHDLPDCFVKLVDICKGNVCRVCWKSFPTKTKLTKHLYNAGHRNKLGMPFTKAAKQESVPNKTEQSVAEETEENEEYKCPLCFRIFKYAFNRARHMRDQCIKNFTQGHKGKVGKLFKCPLCYSTFNHASNRCRHIKLTCMREYNYKHLRKNSMKTNSEHKEDIQQTDGQNSSVMTPDRTGLFKCKVCPAVYAHYSGLYRHAKKHEQFKITGKTVRYRRSVIGEQSKDSDVSQIDLPLKEDVNLSLSCHFCGRSFNNTYSLKKHMRKHRGGKPYRCPECGKGFRKQAHLLAHKKIHQRRIQCTVCKKIVPTITDLIQHRQSHIKKGVLQCPDCPMQFQYPIYLLRHMPSHQLKDNSTQLKTKQDQARQDQARQDQARQDQERQDQASQYQARQYRAKPERVKVYQQHCPICKEVFESPKALRVHCLKHSKASSRDCPFCKRHFTQRQSMIRHMGIHTGEKPYSCQICNKRFHRKAYMEMHQSNCSGPQASPVTTVRTTVRTTLSKGPQVKPAVTLSKGPQAEPAVITRKKGRQKIKCSYCPREFEKRSRFKKHLLSHKSNSLIPCKKCGCFFGKNKFKRHEKDCYAISHLCGGCGKGFSRKCSQIIHEKTCTSIVLQQSSVRKSTRSKDNHQYKCPHCSNMFRYRSYLLRHLQTHNRDQFSCMHCGQRYTSQYRYLQHEAFCDGVRKLRSSNVTTETLPALSGLREAKNPSQGDVEGEYRCKFCTKTFMKSRSLRRHILTHNEVKPYRCRACDSCFSRHDHLKLHQTRCKGKRQRLEVRIAKVSLDDIGKGWQNKLSLNKERLNEWACSSCSRRFTSESNLARHFSLQHATLKPFRCNRCGNSFTQEKSLRRHKNLNTCVRTASAKTGSLLQRVNSVRESTRIREMPNRETNGLLQRNQLPFKRKLKYSCKYCPRAFKGSEALKVHLRLHTGEKPYGCADCGERFIRRDYLRRHLLKCDLRGGCLDTALCEKCGGVFSSDKLPDHQNNCTVKSTAPRPKSSESTHRSPPRGFSCANCSSRFLLFSQLQQHFLNTHRGEPPVKSTNRTLPLHQQLSNMMAVKEEPSDDGFGDTNRSTNNELLFIEDTDSGEGIARPFPCPQCDMHFVNKGGLSRHMLVHAGTFPFNCKRCKKGFWNKNYYRKHVAKCIKRNLTKVDHSSDIGMTSEMESALNDNVLVFNKGSQTTGTGVLQTNFSCKDELNATQEDSTRGKESHQRKGSSSEKNKAVQYQCSECDQSFTDGLMLISHLEDHGREEQQQKLSTCNRCGKKCSSPGNLERHMRVHVNDKTYYCPECPKTFLSPSDLDIHRTCHDPNRPFSCVECKHRFWNSQSLGKHYSEFHSGDSYTCYLCNKSYKMRGSLARHCRMRHQTHLSNEADGPVKGTGNMTGFGGHVNEEKDTSDVDETSNEDENDENDASEDNDSDSAPYFPCHVCGKTFLTSESLEDHQRCHLGEKPHECAECGKCFFHAAQLQQHQRSHKSEFQCQTCGRGFVSLFALRKHKHTHGKSRPHRCPKCHLSFTGPSQLAEHLATHREDNFPCDICDRTFSCKISRAEHRKIHTEQEDAPPAVTAPEKTAELSPPASSSEVKDMKYACNLCKEPFNDHELLLKHDCTATREGSSTDVDVHSSESNKQSLHVASSSQQMITSQPYLYTCNQCHMSFAYRKSFINHLRKHVKTQKTHFRGGGKEATATKIYKCPICPHSFAQAMELCTHLSVHSENVYYCKICKMTFHSKSKLAEHERCHMTAATQYECTECGKNFLGKDAFRQHHCSRRQRAVKDSESPHPSTSKSAKTSKQAPEEEELDVGEDFFNCLDCSKRFFLKDDLVEHQKKYHPSKLLFKCKHCGKTFPLKRYLRDHERRQHNTKAEEAPPKETTKQLKCSQCPKSFDLPQDLQLHMRMHAEQEVGEHRCDMCYKSFSQLSRLRQHQESHVGQVVYECTECDKAFAFPHLLDEHQQTHVVSNI